MKKTLKLAIALLAMSFAFTNCSKDDNSPKDVDIVGNLSLAGKLVSYSMQNTGWIEEDKAGVFVLSDGFPQNNIEYSSTINNEKDAKGRYDRNSPAKEECLLKANSDVVAGFKSGKHDIYAYVPFNSGSTDVENVVLPDVSSQKALEGQFNVMFTRRAYNFLYAKASVEKYSKEPVSLGEFKNLYSVVSLGTPHFEKELEGKKCNKIIISSTENLSYAAGSTINLKTLEIKGEGSKKAEITFDEPQTIIYNKRFDNYGFMMPIAMTIGCPFEKALNLEYTITFVVDGKEYKAVAKPSEKSKENNINLANQYDIVK